MAICLYERTGKEYHPVNLMFITTDLKTHTFGDLVRKRNVSLTWPELKEFVENVANNNGYKIESYNDFNAQIPNIVFSDVTVNDFSKYPFK